MTGTTAADRTVRQVAEHARQHGYSVTETDYHEQGVGYVVVADGHGELIEITFTRHARTGYLRFAHAFVHNNSGGGDRIRTLRGTLEMIAVGARPPGVDGPSTDLPVWRTTSNPPVPVTEFGKDHWSTLAYIETRIVDHGGLLMADQMRCHSGRHPMLAAARRRSLLDDSDGSQYPTQLKNGKLEDHDDYDCADDLIAAGLLEAHMSRPHPDGRAVYITHNGAVVTRKMLNGMDVPSPYFTSGMDELVLMAVAVFTLTPEGQRVAGQLRAHKGNGGNYHEFTPDPLPAPLAPTKEDNPT